MACKVEIKGRPMGGTEQNWCRAVKSGTGITVLALQLSIYPNMSLLENSLYKLQNAHPILKYKLHFKHNINSFSFDTPTTNHPQVDTFDMLSTQDLLKENVGTNCISSLQSVLEYELDQNPWSNPENYSDDGVKMFHVSLYVLEKQKWVVVLRLHTAVCDRTTAVGLLRELRELMEKGEGEGPNIGTGKEVWVSMGIEDLIPKKKTKKTLWAHGLDTLSYSVNSLRLSNIGFADVRSKRSSKVVRWQMSSHETTQILRGCVSKGIKLCGLLSASALMAANSIKCRSDNRDRGSKYAVITLTDCRSFLDPPLSAQDFGFYHSAIFNTHVVKQGENLWDLATKTFKAFANSKNCDKHFSDMADLNFLMRKAIDNPGLTSSSSLRTSLVTVFEDPVIDNSVPLFAAACNGKVVAELGLEDYMGCSSVHGVGPSIAIFDTIREGQLDCVCVYPSPLHSREQMQEMVDEMKRILVEGSN